MVLLLLICCLVCFSSAVGGSVFVFVLVCITLCPFKFCKQLERKRESAALLLLSYYEYIVTVYVL